MKPSMDGNFNIGGRSVMQSMSLGARYIYLQVTVPLGSTMRYKGSTVLYPELSAPIGKTTASYESLARTRIKVVELTSHIEVLRCSLKYPRKTCPQTPKDI